MKQRTICMGFPSGKLKMTLWEGTEDARAFPIKAHKTKPYVQAYGKKYFLNYEEIKTMNAFINAFGGR